VQTASSTSLVAVHLACQSLLSGESDIALAGGVSVLVPQRAGYVYEAGGIRSPDGHTRAFDAGAKGTIFGSGVGIVVLKPLRVALADGDHVHAVIKGSAINNDGSAKGGYTAPSRAGQAAVVARALAVAGIEPDTIGYIEAHGTGTAVGDPVELSALMDVFQRRATREHFCAIGTAKANIGHPSAAAGIAGLIKAVLTLEHKQIPPSLHFERPNPALDAAGSPFFVNTVLSRWVAADTPRRAGVTALGFGGTNAHVVLEEAPPRRVATASRRWQLLVVSAKTGSALETATDNLARHLERHPDADLPDVAYTLQRGRREFAHRRMLVCESAQDAATALAVRDPRRLSTAVSDPGERPVAFMFPGHGSQYVNMTRDLYRAEPVFRSAVEACCERLMPLLGSDLRGVLYPPPGEEEGAARQLEQTLFTQPALFVVGYALGQLWMQWGIRPQAVIGYSVGEYAAACLAGIFSLDDALTLVTARARLAQRIPAGAMLAIALPEAEAGSWLGPGLSLAAISGPSQCVVAGVPDRIDALRSTLTAERVACKRLSVTRAFHSEMLDPVLGEYRDVVRGAALHPPRIGLLSSLTGTWIRPDEATDPEYWVREVRETVRFSDGIRELSREPRRIFLELGPGHALTALVRGHPDVAGDHVVVPSCRHAQHPRSDVEVLLNAAGRLWLAGARVEWSGLHADEQRRRTPLPTYPFERQRYWVDPPLPGAEPGAPAERRPRVAEPAENLAPVDRDAAPEARPRQRGRPRPSLSTAYVAPTGALEIAIAELWQETLGIGDVGLHDTFFELGGDSLTAVQLISRVRDALRVDVPLADFLKAPTVSELAATVVAHDGPREAGADEMARILDEIEGLSTGAVREQLTREQLTDEQQPTERPAAARATPRNGTSPHGTAPDGASPVRPLERCQASAPELPPLAPPAGERRAMEFSLFLFSGDEAAFPDDKYRLVMEGAKFADRHGFTAVWTPERHFNRFGGLYPNPSVLGAAIAAVTTRIQIRGGSVVVPLHHPVRIAEEWALVDNLSKGRAGLAFASGFHPNDFVFAPDDFADRRDRMFQGIETIRRLWRGEALRYRAGDDREVDVTLFPRPVQSRLPIWLATTNSPDTFIEAGRLGANVLTALLRLRVEDLADRIRVYRESLRQHGHDPRAGTVTVMLHTFVGPDAPAVRATVTRPLTDYLRSHLEFIKPIADRGGAAPERTVLSDADRDSLLAHAFDRYYDTSSLLGTPETCLRMVDRLAAIGVDEVACLVDFGVDVDSVMEGLRHLSELKSLVTARAARPSCALAAEGAR
jgi:natural product biosynthesis luciferase-like monooxygenase protein